MQRPFTTTAYRYPLERLILVLTFVLFILVIALTATATICLSAIFIIGLIALSYYGTRSHHRSLLQKAHRVTLNKFPGLISLIEEVRARLQVKDLDIFVTPSNTPNAYTFGLSSPKTVVLYSALFEIMDADELRFILGHEMGHVRLGHTWLNTLVGGMAGIPSSYTISILLLFIFRWWNRACEYSADRAGLLACGKPEKAISALIKLVAGVSGTEPANLKRALSQIETEDDDVLRNIGSLLSTHPMIIKRIEQLRSYAKSSEYKRLQSLVNQNLNIN